MSGPGFGSGAEVSPPFDEGGTGVRVWAAFTVAEADVAVGAVVLGEALTAESTRGIWPTWVPAAEITVQVSVAAPITVTSQITAIKRGVRRVTAPSWHLRASRRGAVALPT